ncbi:hypothetical protein FOWG_16727 [Fusarium oxysporum f. sp. lycopersici MN25]|nr:hypothetical protein FOWG_16727 [Fusarium oxysporum f. sp. lycopersici MN25]
MEPLAPNLANSTGTYCMESSVVSVPEDGVPLPLFRDFIAPSFEDQSFSSLYPYLNQDTDSLFHKQWLDTSSAFQTDASLGQTQETNSEASLVGGNPLKVPDIDATGSANKKLPAARELHIRENNRKAADKHRNRKRREVEGLVARQKTLEAQNNYLYASYNSLRVETVNIKWQLLQHTDCDCVMIQQYIENEAKRCLHSLLS